MIKLQDHAKNYLRSKDLSKTEISVCEKLLVHGCILDAADSLFVSFKTVKHHLTYIYAKLGIEGKGKGKLPRLLIYLLKLN